jgi:hypothetical protein
MEDRPRSRLPYNDAILDSWWSSKISPGLGTPGLRGQLSALFYCEGCRGAPLYHLKLLVWAMVPLLNCSLKDRRNQFECSILYRLLLFSGRTLPNRAASRKATELSIQLSAFGSALLWGRLQTLMSWFDQKAAVVIVMVKRRDTFF